MRRRNLASEGILLFGHQLTAQQVALQALGQADMRRPQSIMELVEAAAVVLTLQVSLDVLKQGLDTLEAGVERSNLVLGGGVLENLRVTSITLGGLHFHVLKDGIGGLVLELDAASKVNELSGDARICDGVLWLL